MKKTFHEGAELERRAFKAYLKRQLNLQRGAVPAKLWGSDILEWVQGRCDRYKKRKGGL